MRMMFNQVFIKTRFSKIFIFEIDFDSSELVDGSFFLFSFNTRWAGEST